MKSVSGMISVPVSKSSREQCGWYVCRMLLESFERALLGPTGRTYEYMKDRKKYFDRMMKLMMKLEKSVNYGKEGMEAKHQ